MTELYDGMTAEQWKEELAPHEFWNKRHLYGVWSLFGEPGSMLDVGCGLGEAVKIAHTLHIEAYGVDQLVDEEYTEHYDYFFHHDLRTPFSLGQVAGISVVDLILCWEVGEHIPSENIGVFCDTLCSHLKRASNSILCFTAAHPGQGGTEHLSTRPALFWREEFHFRGLNFMPEKTATLALLWSNIGSPKYWLPANLQLFTR